MFCVIYTEDSLSCLTGGAAASLVHILAEGRGTNVESEGKLPALDNSTCK